MTKLIDELQQNQYYYEPIFYTRQNDQKLWNLTLLTRAYAIQTPFIVAEYDRSTSLFYENNGDKLRRFPWHLFFASFIFYVVKLSYFLS